MKNKSHGMRFGLFTLILFWGASIKCQELKVLVVGNSVFSRNSQLAITSFQDLCLSNHKSIRINSYLLDGTSVYENLRYQVLHKDEGESMFWESNSTYYDDFKSKMGGYDWIVLQGPSIKDRFLFEIIHAISGEAFKNTKILVFQNYNDILWNDSLSKEKVDKIALYFSEKCPDLNSADLLPVGALFQKVHSKLPGLNLLADGAHPSRIGSYLISVCLYWKMLQGPPVFPTNQDSLLIEPNDLVKLNALLTDLYHETISPHRKN